MRTFAVALAIGLLASVGGLGASVQQAAAGSPQPKVVLVVGAVEGTTSSYRADADAYTAEFLKFTSNVVKVYSPNATWANVKAAAAGASVLVYLGHGSGYPNPYISYLQPAKDDGMGLNSSAGNGDSNKQYYGANYMAQLGLAPNAIVMLNHLCYASGNNEPGLGLPSLVTAKTRIDGYASGFLKGNARAVIAEALGDLRPYIDAIFTPHRLIDQIWRTYPGNHNNFTIWGGVPDYVSERDPDSAHPQSDGDIYYRSMVYKPGLTTDQIGVGLTYLPTTYHPITPPARILDTRSGTGLTGKFVANTPRTFQVTTVSGIPTGATAVTGNLTVSGESSNWAAYIGPDPVSYPQASTLNFFKGDITSNGVTVALSSTGSLSATFMGPAGNTTDLTFDVTGYFTPDTTGDTYHPVTPARIVDSRKGIGLATKLTSGSPGTFAVWLKGGVPNTAKAVTGNVTTVNSNSTGSVYLGADANPSPTTPTINFRGRQVLANNVTVALSNTGTLSATFVGAPGSVTDLVFDVTGYYTQDLTGALYVPIVPVRLLDSRSQNGLSSKLTASVPRRVQIMGRGGVATGAQGITGNVTIVNETNAWAAFVGPIAAANPPTSTINFVKGDVRANGLTVPLGSGGILNVTYLASAKNTTDMVLDVSGYFIAP